MAHEMNLEDYRYLQSLEGNDACVDCGTKSPDWGSPTLGILFCFKCSGVHRSLGTHLSFVRSVTMDGWTEKQIRLMRLGGNQQCINFLRSHGVDTTTSIREKYDSPAAELYRQTLKARLEGLPEPTELPQPAQAKPTLNRKMEGFGSAPPPDVEKKGYRNLKRAALIAVPVAAVALWFALPH